MGKKVLIIDDEIHITKIIKYILASEGYEVIQALDGEEGLQSAIKELPDLVLLDVMMPKLDGFKVLELLKENKGTKDIPVVMVTVKTQQDDTLKAERLGASDYIYKPFSPKKVLEIVKKHTE